MTPEGERRKQQLLALIQGRGQGSPEFNTRPAAEQFRADNDLDPLPLPSGNRELQNGFLGTPPSADQTLADTYGGRSPDVQGLFTRAAAKNAGGVAHAQEATPAVPEQGPPTSTKDQFLRAVALKGSPDQDNGRRDTLQTLQDFDTNMQIAPNLIDVASWGNPSQMIQYGGSSPPSATRQKEIDEINQSERDTKKNAAEIESARVKQQAAAQELRGMPAADAASLSNMETASAQLDDIEKELPKYAGKVGPFDEKWGKAMEFFGADPEGAAFRQQIYDLHLKYRNEITGANFSPKEARDLQSANIHPGDTEESIKAKIPNLKKGLARARQSKLENMKNAGFNTSKFDQGGAAAGGEKRAALDPSGKPGKLPADSDLSKYPGWKWA